MTDDALTLSVLDAMALKYHSDPVMMKEIEDRIRFIRENGELRPSVLDELRETWERDTQEQIEFLKQDTALLGDIVMLAPDEKTRQYAEYILRIEQDDLAELIGKEELPKWLS
ncbi:MAG: hypothetical protein JXO48_02550 [Deltaproteobacteria bacterium]|nr:hypothetical protein [Deltaproteobacteria bacterium]